MRNPLNSLQTKCIELKIPDKFYRVLFFLWRNNKVTSYPTFYQSMFLSQQTFFIFCFDKDKSRQCWRQNIFCGRKRRKEEKNQFRSVEENEKQIFQWFLSHATFRHIHEKYSSFFLLFFFSSIESCLKSLCYQRQCVEHTLL